MKTKIDMVAPQSKRGIIGELIIALTVVLLAVWASSALLAQFFLGNPHLGPIPLLPLALSPLQYFAFPILATVTGIALAQGSAAGRQSSQSRLGRIYDNLASHAVERFEAGASPEVHTFINRVSDYLEQNQRARIRSDEARYVLAQLASEFRELASQVRPSQPSVSEQYAQLAQSVSDLVTIRRLEISLERQDDRPMLTGETCELHLRFVQDLNQSVLPADFGGRSRLDLTLFLFGQGVSLRNSSLAISLPLTGESTQASTTLQWMEAPDHNLRIVVATAGELKVLQTYWTALDVTPVHTAAG